MILHQVDKWWTCNGYSCLSTWPHMELIKNQASEPTNKRFLAICNIWSQQTLLKPGLSGPPLLVSAFVKDKEERRFWCLPSCSSPFCLVYSFTSIRTYFFWILECFENQQRHPALWDSTTTVLPIGRHEEGKKVPVHTLKHWRIQES